MEGSRPDPGRTGKPDQPAGLQDSDSVQGIRGGRLKTETREYPSLKESEETGPRVNTRVPGPSQVCPGVPKKPTQARRRFPRGSCSRASPGALPSGAPAEPAPRRFLPENRTAHRPSGACFDGYTECQGTRRSGVMLNGETVSTARSQGRTLKARRSE